MVCFKVLSQLSLGKDEVNHKNPKTFHITADAENSLCFCQNYVLAWH
jgi:hypothetical protein